MDQLLLSFHNILWDNLFVSEIGLSNSIPKEKIERSLPTDMDAIHYTKIDASFQDYGEHLHKYIWGDGIACLWEENKKRTCYFPWDYKCSAWNSARLFSFSPIHKIVITSTNNQQRNLGLKIQASSDHVKWKTLYTINNFDVKRMVKEPLEIFFFDDTKYLYVRVIQENSTNGYDIESIKIYVRDSDTKLQNTQNSIFYVLSGTMNVNGLRYKAPFGLLKLSTNSFSLSAAKESDTRVFWITFDGTDAIKLLEKANFDFNTPLFEIKHSSYLKEINNFVNEQTAISGEENQFHLLSRLMTLLAMHAKYNDLKTDEKNTQEKYIILALQYIDYNRYANITLADIAEQCSISEKYLIKIFKDSMGTTPIQYLNNWKIHKSKKLLRTTHDSIESISQQLGFSSPEYFCRMFKKHERISPSQYRKNKRAEGENKNP